LSAWPRGSRRAWAPFALAWLALAGGCVLADVTVAEGGDLLVVEAVLRAGAPRQAVMLHRSLTDLRVRGEPGARVVVADSAGTEFVFVEADLQYCIADTGSFGRFTLEASCYLSPESLWVRPGALYRLEVTSTRGERLRSVTRVPGDFQLQRLPAETGAPDGATPTMHRCYLDALTPLPLAWSPAAGAWSYIAVMRVTGLREVLAGSGIADVPDPLELTGLSISERDTAIVVPAHFGVFERGRFELELLQLLQLGFPPNVTALVFVAAVDRNYVNAVRGGSFNPSGSVRVSSVVGDGVGTFGSLVVRMVEIVVREPGRTPPQGLEPCLPRNGSPPHSREEPGGFSARNVGGVERRVSDAGY
jgi:hypothetical protein